MLQVWIEEEQKEYLERRSEETKRSMASLIRELIEEDKRVRDNKNN